MALGEPRVMTATELMDFEQSDRCQAFSHKSILLRPEGRFEPHTFTCIEGRHAGMGDSHR